MIYSAYKSDNATVVHGCAGFALLFIISVAPVNLDVARAAHAPSRPAR